MENNNLNYSSPEEASNKLFELFNVLSKKKMDVQLIRTNFEENYQRWLYYETVVLAMRKYMCEIEREERMLENDIEYLDKEVTQHAMYIKINGMMDPHNKELNFLLNGMDNDSIINFSKEVNTMKTPRNNKLDINSFLYMGLIDDIKYKEYVESGGFIEESKVIKNQSLDSDAKPIHYMNTIIRNVSVLDEKKKITKQQKTKKNKNY